MRLTGSETASADALALDHERVVLQRGRRSELTMIVAVHSTRLGPAIGGCRMWTYPSWQDGLADALRLSQAMSWKSAAAGLDHGGGKAVVVLPPGTVLSAERRIAAMRDLGDIVDGFGGTYIVGEDVGTTAQDMLVVRDQTKWVGGLPASAGGSGEPAEPTAVGVYAAIEATAQQAFGTSDLTGLRACVIGLGQVGERLARRLLQAGAAVSVSDIDVAKKSVAQDLGAQWLDPEEALFADTDLLIPAALGGILRPDTLPRLRCAAVVGPANNQLSDDSVADLLAEQGIVWAPDFIVNAGGIVFAVRVSFDGKPADEALADVQGIGARLTAVFDQARLESVSPLTVALASARDRLSAPRR